MNLASGRYRSRFPSWRRFRLFVQAMCNDLFRREGPQVPLLTIYRPNFCCECGGKIVRLRWRFWHSRKYCPPCGSLYRKQRFVQPAINLAAVLIVGILVGRALHPKPPPLTIQRASTANATGTALTPQQAVAVDEQIYICGARTKKGTPCSRRVNGPVRCWQHKGMKPMMQQEKLLVKD